MLDHKLTIFYHTAKHLNTTKAAEILRLSQPAISKSIKELEKGLGITLFDREKGRLMLTPAGKYLLEQSEELIERERIITFNLQHMKKEFSGTLHIGASTTLSQYILPEYLARFRETHPYIEINLISGNTYQIEQELLDKNIQLAFIEGVPSQTDIHYIPFLKDEIVLVTSAKNDSPESITKEQLKTLKFVVREEGSGTYNIIQRQLSAAGMSINELNQQIVIGSTEGIKQYLKHSDCYALVSVFSIQDELSCGLLKIIDIDDIEISRTLYAIHKQGTIDPYAELLLDSANPEIENRNDDKRFNLNMHVTRVPGNINNWKFTPCIIYGFHKYKTFLFCHFPSTIGIIQKIQCCQISNIIFRTILSYILQITTSQHISIIPTINHTSTFALSQGSL